MARSRRFGCDGEGGRTDQLIGDDPTVAEIDDPLAALGDVGFVRDHEDGDALVVQAVEDAEDGVAGGGVEVSGRLVSQKDERFVDQGAGDGGR